jgi:uncharacterized membrane protein HdeD (DUF308 family)
MRKTNWIDILTGFIMIIASIFAFTNPNATITTLAMIAGIIIMLRGIVLIFDYIRLRKILSVMTAMNTSFTLVFGIILILFGSILLITPSFFITLFAVVIAIWCITDAIQGLALVHIYKEIHPGLFIFGIIFNLLLLTCGLMLVLKPIIAIFSLSFLLGCSLMLAGIRHMVYGITGE